MKHRTPLGKGSLDCYRLGLKIGFDTKLTETVKRGESERKELLRIADAGRKLLKAVDAMEEKGL